jgi:hypothetical protein
VQKTDEYLKHARECRALARQMEQGEHRDQLLKMAETWEVLSNERQRTLRTGDETAARAAMSKDGEPTAR